MMKKLTAFCTVLAATMSAASAINIVGNNLKDSWGYSGGDNVMDSVGDFIIGGAFGESNDAVGTFGAGDEYAIIGVIASKVSAHGGYFCPYQLQCANKNGDAKTWTTYYKPNGFSDSKCAWLCQDGYAGTNCKAVNSTPLSCDESVLSGSDSRFSGISLKQSGGGADMCELDISGFDQWGKSECDVILGVVRFLDHGVAAAPVRVCCGYRRHGGVLNKKKTNSFVTSADIVGEEKVLCAEGYKVNSLGTDCELINAAACEIENIVKENPMCSGFNLSNFDPNVHKLDSEGGCTKFSCLESGYAFPAVGDTRCVECDTTVKGGAHPKTGVCVKCETGEYFNAANGTCDSANAYTKTDMQYGKGQTKNTLDISRQCWTKVVPDEYKACVENGGATTK